MKGLNRIEVKEAFRGIVEKYGKPRGGDVYCEEQLISEIISVLTCYDEVNISFEYGRFVISPSVAIKAVYADDHTVVGTVYVEEWFTKEQIKALHELGFGYIF